MIIEFLLRRHMAGNEEALKIAVHVLKAMSRGGMYDVVGGGFSRYSVDNFWRVPHFDKWATQPITSFDQENTIRQ